MVGNDSFVDFADCNLLVIWSFDPVAVADFLGSRVEIGELSDAVVDHAVTVQEEGFDYNVVLNHSVTYPHIIS